MPKFGLVGFPLKNTFSKDFFIAKFSTLGLNDFSYENFSIENIDQITNVLKSNPDIGGFNVTIPYKESILNFLDEIDESAKTIGAVNCVKVNSQSKLIGFNSDAFGFEKTIIPIIKDGHQKALILGTGGVAKAVAYVLKNLHIDFKFVSRKLSLQSSTIQFQNLNSEIITSSTLIINCTPVGMFPNPNEFPNIPFQFISSKHFCYDLIYLPEKTLFLEKCETQGASIKSGLEMLHLQAEKSWEIWNSKFEF